MKGKSQLILINVCIPVAVLENTVEPVLPDWSLLQESVGQDQADNANTTVETSVIHPEPPPSWNTTSVRMTHALMRTEFKKSKFKKSQTLFICFIQVLGLILNDSLMQVHNHSSE